MKRKRYFRLYEVCFLSLMAALVYILKTFFKTPIGLPGHTAIFWVIPFIIGTGVTRKFGSGVYIGVLSGLLIGAIGMADTGFLKVFEYTAMGLTMDVIALAFKDRIGNPLVGIVLGAFGSFSKMIIDYSITSALSLNAHILLAGIGIAGTVHLVFGGAGGLISCVILNRVKKLHFHTHPSKDKDNFQQSRL
ncbi:MAG TPA: hypothetical protein VK209_06525 [Candidatus Sulfotelmatobacter sp.]|nr:hypothetical protein [Candidatus Sulfotelmatobacter sp.]